MCSIAVYLQRKHDLTCELQRIMLKIYCEMCWLILVDIEIIYFEKNMWLCSGGFCKCNDACFTHSFDFALLIIQRM